ncbi:MAG TPA: DUF892 family protein [Beijerinckia sp.]|jgi:ferritin-like metal-binding protein YciE|nr:DUF892 family protein [Beijerinckia sp.]
MVMKSMNDLFLHTLKDIYYAEKKIYKSLPKMAKNASSPELKEVLEKHREETGQQIVRLESIFEQCGAVARSVRSDAMDAILAEAKDLMQEVDDDIVCDAGMVAAAQAVKHYEISRYSTLAAWADQLGMQEASKLLHETLAEEEKTNDLLSRIELGTVTKKAA